MLYDSFDPVTCFDIIFITELSTAGIFTLTHQLAYHVLTLQTRVNRIHMTLKFVSPLRSKFRCL